MKKSLNGRFPLPPFQDDLEHGNGRGRGQVIAI